MIRLSLTFLGVCLPVQAADWPCWRGPDRSGISADKGLRKEWPEMGPPLVWKIKGLGSGYSTPSVVKSTLYVMASKESEEFVHAIDTKKGEILWFEKVGKEGENRGPSYPGPRSTLTIDWDKLYTLGSDGDLVCLERSRTLLGCGGASFRQARESLLDQSTSGGVHSQAVLPV